MDLSSADWPEEDALADFGIDISRVTAEIEAEAEDLRRTDADMARIERDIERAWADVAPVGATGRESEQLLDRVDRLATIDADVPIGSRRGLRVVKWAIRKSLYWYLRYMADQINAVASVGVRLLRHLDGRVSALEDASHSSMTDDALFDDPPEPSPDTAAVVASLAGSVPRAVMRRGHDRRATEARCGDVYGVGRDPRRILAAARLGLDVRADDAFEHLGRLSDRALDTVVLAGEVETLPLAAFWQLVAEVERVLGETGRIIVAVADPARRGHVEAEIRAGRGLAPETWRHLLERAGFAARLVPAPGPRITELVVAERP